MTPAEQKARELYDKFFPFVNGMCGDAQIVQTRTKNCALICLEEIIEEVRDFCDDNHHQDRMNFYINVRTAIEQMP